MTEISPVGIVDVAHYAPDRFMTAAELAELTGIPEHIILWKFGLVGKHIAADDEHVSHMCLAAARSLLERHDAFDVDAVVYFGSHWKDYAIWQVAPKVQHELGIDGFSLELVNVSAGAPIALKVVGDMMAADPGLRNVLLIGASRESHLVDYTNERSRFMFSFGDGAVAALLRRNHDANLLRGSSIYTDGSFSHHVKVPGGGSVHPTSEETVRAGLHRIDVDDPLEMKRRLDPITVKNFVRVVRDAVGRAGAGVRDIDLILPIHFKRSLHEDLLVELELAEHQAVYLDHYGHMSAVDPLFSLALARDTDRLRAGDLVVFLAAGTGYTWAATALRWGPA